MAKIVYDTDEEKKQARRDRATKKRRLNGISERKKFNSQEERTQSKKEIWKRHYESNINKIKKRSKDWDKNNYHKKISRRREWMSLNRDKNKENKKKWRDANIDKIKKNYEKHRNKIILRCKEYIKKNPHVKKRANQNWKDKNTGYDSDYYLKNKDKILSRSKLFYSNNVTKKKVYNSDYRKSNREKFIESINRRREKSKHLYENFSVKNVKQVFINFDSKCFKCKSSANLQIDHHYPLSKGYPLTINNAVILCKPCNSSKRAKLPEYFYTSDQLLELEKNHGICKQFIKIMEQPSLLEA